MSKLTHLYILIGCLFFSSLSFAQEKKEEDTPSNKLQFYLINGLDIAYTDLSSDFPLRYAVSITGNYDKDDLTTSQNYLNDNDSSKFEGNSKNKRFDYKIKAKTQYIKSLYQKESFHAYIGIGPTISFQRSYYNVKNKNIELNTTYSDNNSRDYWTNNYSVGISSTLGIEAKMLENIALFAEYDLNVSYRWSSQLRKIINDKSLLEYNTNSSGYSLILNSLRLGASIYF